MISPLRPWVDSKLAIAQCLADGGCGGGIAEAYLIVSAILSRLSAGIWPRQNKNDRIDRKRFVELWARYADGKPHPNLISIPLLIADLERTKRTQFVQALRETHKRAFDDSELLVISGSDVDLPEGEVIGICPSLSVSTIREFSYGNVFYQHVRSGYVHEYQTTAHASPDSMPFVSVRGKGVSYVNELNARDDRKVRRIHFELPWLVSIVGSITDATASLLVTSPYTQPRTWWLDGGGSAARQGNA